MLISVLIFLTKKINIQSNSVACDYLPNKNYRYISNINIEITDCFFYRTTTYSGHGGIIYCNDAVINMVVKDCIFFECSVNSQGGAIYYYCNHLGSHSKLERVCGNKCSCGSNQQNNFAYIQLYDSISSNNFVSYVSVTKCNIIDNGISSFRLQCGNMSVSNYNSTFNTNKQYSGINLFKPSQLIANYCTFFNNIVSNSVCICFTYLTNNILSYSNIINNNSPSNYGVVYVGSGTYKVENFIFSDNKNTLFYVN